MTSTKKVQRLLQIEALLLAHPEGMTQAEIARRLGVHRSTVHRYLPDLPKHIYVDDLDGARWKIDRSAYLINLRLTLHEAMAVHLASRLLATRSDKHNPHAAAALRKLSTALEALAPRISDHLRQSADVMDGPSQRRDPVYLQTLEKLTLAWAQGTRTRVWHRHEPSDEIHEYTFAPYFIEPYAIGRTSHVIGYRDPPGALRTFKIERIERVDLLDELYEIPDDFDPEKMLADAWGIWYSEDREPIEVVLRFHPGVAKRVRETRWHASEMLEDQEDGSLLWRAQVGSTTEMLPWIRGWGADVEVLAPPDLRRRVRRHVQRLRTLYELKDDAAADASPTVAEPPPGQELVAHTPNESGKWHLLEDHLRTVADLASEFGDRFGAKESTFIAGLFHDIGKANPKFQRYLRAAEAGRRVEGAPHSIWGSVLLYEMAGKGSLFHEIGLPIAGHHGGLKEPSLVLQEVLVARDDEPELIQSIAEITQDLPVPDSLKVADATPLQRELRTRMVLSALVDADRLDTERHMDPQTAEVRGAAADLQILWDRFEEDQGELMQAALDTPVNRVRRDVYRASLDAAQGPRGLYRLTVPTGGGKTRSGLAFGLQHALKHGMERVIVAIPYTSIIDQTADVYRNILGQAAVLEHHSNLEPLDDEKQDPHRLRLRLAAQNWDALLIVTTTVQLFESLFSHHPSRARKVHRIANSVIILDEVQTLPTGLIEPTIDLLHDLIERYGVTVVLSTATQPALTGTPYISAFENVEAREIVPGFRSHFEVLKRVRYDRMPGRPSWQELARHVESQSQALVILNTRQDALDLLDRLPEEEGTFHLSTLLCPAHRRECLHAVRARLQAGAPIRLVSTQVVEAGVDLDFPVVYRAVGPLDRIVQAAGRCNREGRIDAGTVYLFEAAEAGAPRGPYRHGMGLASSLISRHGPEALHDPSLYEEYFEQLFAEQNLDEHGIQRLRRALNFRKTSQRYRLIPEETIPVVVDYEGKGHEIAREWSRFPRREGWLRMQPYTVSVYPHELDRYLREGWAAELTEGLYLWHGQYDRLRGLSEHPYDPADLVR